jgi:hypothetical protein
LLAYIRNERDGEQLQAHLRLFRLATWSARNSEQNEGIEININNLDQQNGVVYRCFLVHTQQGYFFLYWEDVLDILIGTERLLVTQSILNF